MGRVADSLSSTGLELTTFAEVEPEPHLETVETLYEKCRSEGCAVICGVGGGSVMDVAKLAAQSTARGASPRDYIEGKVPARQPYLLMGYKTPIVGRSDEPWEPYALYVLSSVLDGGDSARLSRQLVRGSGVAASAGAEYGTYGRLPGMFLLDGTPTDGHTVAEVEQALREQVALLREQLVDEQELKRVVTQAIASKVYQADSLFYQAMEIGVLETIGLDWRLIESEIDALKAVTPDQVRTVAQRYLVDENLTVATLKPLPMDQTPARPARATGGRHGG